MGLWEEAKQKFAQDTKTGKTEANGVVNEHKASVVPGVRADMKHSHEQRTKEFSDEMGFGGHIKVESAMGSRQTTRTVSCGG